MVNRRVRLATGMPSDPPTSGTPQTTQDAHRAARIDGLPWVKELLKTYAFPYAALRPAWKVLKQLASFNKTLQSSGCKRRGEYPGSAEMGFATACLHHTARQHNFSMIAYATSDNSRFCWRKPFIWQAEAYTLCGGVFVCLKGSSSQARIAPLPHYLRTNPI